MSLLSKKIQTVDKRSKKELEKMLPITKDIERFKMRMARLSDENLKSLSNRLKKRHKDGETLDSLLPKAYALVYEVFKRVMHIRLHDVQILGAIVLHKNCIAEMATGEGKTFVAVLAAYLHSLDGNGVHVVTVNDYLAKVGATINKSVYDMLDVSVGYIQHDMNNDERRAAYNCDVTYVTNSELGFDYLRDGRALCKEDRVLRPLHYAIIDEADSVLIDEARTPLIISMKKKSDAEFFRQTDRLVKALTPGKPVRELSKADILSGVATEENGDYVVSEKENTVFLTQEGIDKIEKLLGIENLADFEHDRLRYYIQTALRANSLMQKDKDYIVRDGEIVVVNEFTGRLAEGEIYADGLHQALEAKEGLPIRDISQAIASVTYQNLFNLYKNKSGMTGTAMTSAKELKEIYNLKVIAVPSNVSVIREDLEDIVYLTKNAKYNAIVQCIRRVKKQGRPILVGTSSIADSEYLSQLLDKEYIEHVVLNAKQHEKEAEIISRAGRKDAVVIATNMTGRGTDITLTDEARQHGGLFVIGTERHEARRIDDQLRGRAGRQGDPGTTRFFVSLEDDLIRLFGGEKVINMLKTVGVYQNNPISYKGMSNIIATAQKRVESVNFGARRTLMDFDSALSEQKEIVHKQRMNIVEGANVGILIRDMMFKQAQKIIDDNYHKGVCSNQTRFMRDWLKTFGVEIKCEITKEDMEYAAKQAVKRYFNNTGAKFDTFSETNDFQKNALLQGIDVCWAQYINDLERLKQSFTFVTGKRSEVVAEYREKSYMMFREMLNDVSRETIRIFLS